MSKMKTLALLLYVLFALIAWFLLPHFWNGRHGSYNVNTGLIWCDTQVACFHEVGHRLDQNSGWPSQSPEFAAAIYRYGFDAPGIALVEWYAAIFAYSQGDPNRLPVELRSFYDWPLATRLVHQYVP